MPQTDPDVAPITVGDILQSVGILGAVLMLLMFALCALGIFLLVWAKDTRPINIYLVAALLPFLVGIAARSTGEERREEMAARREGVTADSLARVPVIMGVVSSVPALGIGFLGLLLKSGRRPPRNRRTSDPLRR